MTYAPFVAPMNIQQQGATNFPYPANWIDSIVASSSNQAYNVTAARTAMGLAAGEALFVVFSATGGFYADFHKAAVVPTGATTDGSSAEYSPSQRYIDSSITSINIISSGTPVVTMQFYRP